MKDGTNVNLEGHAILAVDYEQHKDGTYTVKLFDENSFNGSSDSSYFIDMNISEDYSNYSFKPYTAGDYVSSDGTFNNYGEEGGRETYYIDISVLPDIYAIGPVYDSNGNFIEDTTFIEYKNAETNTMLINFSMNSDIKITIDEQTFSYIFLQQWTIYR